MWVNRVEQETTVTAAFPSNPIARESGAALSAGDEVRVLERRRGPWCRGRRHRRGHRRPGSARRPDRRCRYRRYRRDDPCRQPARFHRPGDVPRAARHRPGSRHAGGVDLRAARRPRRRPAVPRIHRARAARPAHRAFGPALRQAPLGLGARPAVGPGLRTSRATAANSGAGSTSAPRCRWIPSSAPHGMSGYCR